MASKAQPTVYRFNGLVLDAANEVLRDSQGQRIPLRARSLGLLRLLVENTGRLLTRETIMETLWPNLYVTEDNITQCAHDVRVALGPDLCPMLRTVRGRGYVFEARDVTRESGGAAQGLGAAATAGGLQSVEQSLAHDTCDALPLSDRPSIAVLAFANMSGDPDQEYLSDGIADSIITELSRNRSLFVIARTSSFAYKSRPVGVKQVALELGVRYVVEGSVKRGKNSIRITVLLIDAETDSYIWSERFDGDFANLFTVQDEIIRAIVAAIDPAISQVEQRRAMQKPPERLSAWEAWQRALWHWSKGSDLSTRRVFLERTIALDPSFGSAHAMLVRLYLSEGTLGVGRPLSECIMLAEVEARTALDLDPNSSVAHVALAWVFDHQGDRGAALEEAEIAISLNPNDPQGYLIKGRVLVMSGRPAEARELLATALRLDPRGPAAPAVMHNRAVGCYLEQDYIAAETITRRSIRDYPEHPRSYVWLSATIGQLGRTDDAHAALDVAIAVSGSYLKYKTETRAPYMRPEDHEHFLEGLRKAGWHG